MKYNNIIAALNNSTSDKNKTHRYGIVYDLLFNRQYIRMQRKLNILEIGVSLFDGGGSVIPLANAECVNKYVGLDNRTYKHNIIPNNATLYCGEQYDAYREETVNFLKNKEGFFDIIIDDGPHNFTTQQWFLSHYFELLEPGGVLICEDIWQSNISKLQKLKNQLGLYIIDLRQNRNQHKNEILALRFKRFAKKS